MLKLLYEIIKWYKNTFVKWFKDKLGIDVTEKLNEGKDSFGDEFETAGEFIIIVSVVVIYSLIKWLFF